MDWGSSATSILVGTVGGVLLVVAVVLGRRLGGRRAVGTAGLGLLLVGLTVSGLIDVVARIAFNPLRWVGVGAVAVGISMLLGSGMVPGRRRKRRDSAEQPRAKRPKEVEGKSEEASPAMGDDDLADIEEILRRRGIS